MFVNWFSCQYPPPDYGLIKGLHVPSSGAPPWVSWMKSWRALSTWKCLKCVSFAFVLKGQCFVQVFCDRHSDVNSSFREMKHKSNMTWSSKDKLHQWRRSPKIPSPSFSNIHDPILSLYPTSHLTRAKDQLLFETRSEAVMQQLLVRKEVIILR